MTHDCGRSIVGILQENDELTAERDAARAALTRVRAIADVWEREASDGGVLPEIRRRHAAEIREAAREGGK
ncbi:hypothetical protein [Rhodococcus marinonascens]|uniref:hypothetical protein n=1 Tax=Rhodococcus marinonascens TaxID=38311 RepID=UPI0009329425|nr:hypothetical protein [Rhodococcus marinonascens]